MTRLALLLTLLTTIGNAQVRATASLMPPDRMADSYAIYSSLLPLGETETWPAKFFAVRDATITAVGLSEPCKIPEAQTPLERASSGHNPHGNVTAPDGNRKDYDEVLADFDAHCHERYALDTSGWHTRVPVRLLNDKEQKEFLLTRNTKSQTAEKYKGSPSLYAFSPLYYNVHHTVALVYATHVCGGLCGQGYWLAFQKINGGWKQLNWSASMWIS